MTSHLFLCALFLALIALPIATNAQETRAYRVALVFSTSPMSELTGADPAHPLAKAFVRGMRDLGYVEGQNLVLERRSAEGKFERFPEIFRELVTSKVDVIVTFSSPLARAAKDVTQTVPIVMGVSGNPVEEGLVYPNREFVDIGGLISYGPEVAVLAGRAAQYADRILKGENPANLPVERPTKFELVINLQTAKTLGLTVPASLRLQASQIVE
jgi:ABC-type uncharacterized transport system substrate-binding protein